MKKNIIIIILSLMLTISMVKLSTTRCELNEIKNPILTERK